MDERVALKRLAEAVERTTRAGTVRLAGAIFPMSQEASADVEMRIEGAADLTAGRALLTMHLVDEESHEPRTVLHDGAKIRLHVEGDTWLSIPAGSGGIDPFAMLDLLGGAVATTQASLEPGRTHQRKHNVTIVLDQAIDRARDPDALRRWLVDTDVSGTIDACVWLDAAERIERVLLELPAPASHSGDLPATHVDIHFTDHGAPIDLPARVDT